MLRIRLVRAGRKGQPKFKVVVAEHSKAVKGKFIEKLGAYDPHTKTVDVEEDKISAWIAKGAQPSTTLARLLKGKGMKNMEKFIKHVTFLKKEEPATPVAETAAAPVAEAEATEASAE